MVKGLTQQSSAKAQLGLGHSYSRAKVKFNVHRVDNMIIQSISLLDQLDKDVNTFSMRIRFVFSCTRTCLMYAVHCQDVSVRPRLCVVSGCICVKCWCMCCVIKTQHLMPEVCIAS